MKNRQVIIDQRELAAIEMRADLFDKNACVLACKPEHVKKIHGNKRPYSQAEGDKVIFLISLDDAFITLKNELESELSMAITMNTQFRERNVDLIHALNKSNAKLKKLSRPSIVKRIKAYFHFDL